MKFYCIVENESEDSHKRISLLQDACKKKKIEFIIIFPENFNYTKDKIKPGSLLYRATPGKRSAILEKNVLNDSLVSFYIDLNSGVNEKVNSSFYNEKNGLPVIKTIPDFISNKSALKNYVQYVGGFPVVVKVMGGSHGQGVIKVDSIESLVSLRDYLENKESEIILRKFINHKKQGRLIVLGNKVIASHLNFSSTDFRTNVGGESERKREAFVFSKKVQEIAVQAVKSIGSEFGGVDILFEETTGKPYISEVNFPCFFPTTQRITGIDIAGAMIDFLVKKSKKS